MTITCFKFNSITKEYDKTKQFKNINTITFISKSEFHGELIQFLDSNGLVVYLNPLEPNILIDIRNEQR